jgi:hypothetical protein
MFVIIPTFFDDRAQILAVYPTRAVAQAALATGQQIVEVANEATTAHWLTRDQVEGHVRTGGAALPTVDITNLDLDQVNWEASALSMQIATACEEYALGHILWGNARRRGRAFRDDFQRNVFGRYWSEEELQAVAQQVGCTPREVLDVIISYRD